MGDRTWWCAECSKSLKGSKAEHMKTATHRHFASLVPVDWVKPPQKKT